MWWWGWVNLDDWVRDCDDWILIVCWLGGGRGCVWSWGGFVWGLLLCVVVVCDDGV